MGIAGIPIFSMLRTRMQWHQQRQRILAENVANADTPSFRPRDLKQLNFDAMVSAQAPGVTLLRTSDAHLGASDSSFAVDPHGFYESRPTGNAVNLEDEMMKVASNNMDFQAATALYTRSLGLIKIAIGKK